MLRVTESSFAVKLLLHADWMMLKNASNQGGGNSVTVAPLLAKSRPWMLVASKAAFLENYLAISSWILNGSSIAEASSFQFIWCLIWKLGDSISGWKSMWRWSGRKWAFHPWLLLIRFSKSQSKTHQIVQKFCNGQTVGVESTISNTSKSLRISLDKTYAESLSVQMTSVVNLSCKQYPNDV